MWTCSGQSDQGEERGGLTDSQVSSAIRDSSVQIAFGVRGGDQDPPEHDSRQEAPVEDMSLCGSGDALPWMEIPFKRTVTPHSGCYRLNLGSID
ncbi:hypothetical protein DUI87_20113 [Hirundo rustica rustica]|uniref:Uncharacterized protein n=1 Tax=Hirundo rustica rustica TaxID=333673 RepID=A0A3M0JVX0_HIRRU|nr:hypothetical protein DUI87_20113 [Hirundo rustica rustica]